MFDVTSAEGASVSSNGDGTFGYDPGDVFDGLALGELDTDTFTYQASDGNGVTDTATVTIAITGVNDAPSADADTDTTDEDTANAVDVLTGDTDPDTTDVLVVSAVDATGSNGGSITIDAGGTGVTYDPNGQFDALQVGDSATDTFQYTLSDGNGGTTTATVTMTITGVNDAPTAVDNSYGGVVGNTTAMIGTTSTGPTVALTGSVVRANDTDPDDATSSLTATLVATTTGADVTLNADGSFTYVPPAGVESTTDTFTYTVTDPAGLVSAPATVTLTITADVVWYVDASAAAGGDGRSTGPLQTVDALNTGTPDSLDDSFDYLAVYSGTYAGGITLETGQRLFGQPEGLVLGGNTLIAASGTKPVINGTTYGVTLAGAVDIRDVAVTASAGDGITGVGVDTFTIDAATTVTASGIELMLDGGNGTVTIPTTISSTVGGAVDIRNRTGGSITLTGPITVTGGKGVVSDNNDNSTVAFTGGMTVSSGGSVAFFAVNGGTVTATGTNSLISTSGTTLTVTDTTIGTAGLTFRSVSGSATNGILLSNTGAGTLTVTGDGASDTTNPTRGRTTAKAGGGTVAPGSGGTISGTLGTGISLTNTGPVVLRNMVVQNGSTSGLVATTVDGLTLDNTRISGHAFGSGMHLTSVTGYTVLHSELVGNATAESNRTPKTFNSEFDDTTGTATVTSSIFQNALEQVIQVNNTSGTLNLTMTNTLVTLAGGDGMRVIADGTGNITTTVQGSTFSSNSWGFSAYTQVAAASTQNVTLTGNTFTDGFLGVNISHGSSGTNSFNVSNNDFQRHQSVVINVNRLAGGTFTSFGLFSGTVQSNLIGAAGVVGSGSTGGDGIDVKTNGDGGTTRVAIRSNVIRRVSGQGIYAISRDTPTGHTLEMIIENNDIADLAPVGQDAIQIINGAVAGDVPTVCLDMSDNLATGVRFGLRLRPSGLPVATPTVLVAGWSGGPQTAQAYLEAQNTFSGGTGVSSVSGTYQTTSGCTLP
jgi:VCBS repeat-containing protein